MFDYDNDLYKKKKVPLRTHIYNHVIIFTHSLGVTNSSCTVLIRKEEY